MRRCAIFQRLQQKPKLDRRILLTDPQQIKHFALDVSAVNPRVTKVLDLKAPGSGEEAANRYENLACLRPGDQVKFVIRDEVDYCWARDKVREHRLSDRCEVLFSPVAGKQDPTRLAERILEDRLDVRFQIQLHKHLWGDRTGV